MNFLENQSLSCGSKELELKVPAVMGILNLTPDSFYDGGSYEDTKALLTKAGSMLDDGASILDIGAVSTRPGAMVLSADEEKTRLAEPLKALRKAFPDTILSVDTYRTSVAKLAISEGADIINDISGGLLDNEMIPFISTQVAAYVIMHMQGTPETMQNNPEYDNVVSEVEAFFIQQLSIFKQARKHNLILDPGFGFGKTVEHNFQLLNGIAEFANLCFPILAGVSRKSMINKVLGTKPVTALNGTSIVNTMALLRGANILRVHDVAEAVEAVKLFTVYKQSIFAL